MSVEIEFNPTRLRDELVISEARIQWTVDFGKVNKEYGVLHPNAITRVDISEDDFLDSLVEALLTERDRRKVGKAKREVVRLEGLLNVARQKRIYAQDNLYNLDNAERRIEKELRSARNALGEVASA